MTHPDWEQLKAYVFGRMANELPPNLYYHGLHHTRDDVLLAAARLGSLAGLPPADALLLNTAALYHDFGFIVQVAVGKVSPGEVSPGDTSPHEQASAELAAQTLPDFGYTAGQISQIQGMIMATRLPQTPHNLLEELICDADLDSLGREDFMITSHNLLRELTARGAQIHLKQWYENQLRFLSSHTYFTQTAEQLRGDCKRRNIADLQRRIQALGDNSPGDSSPGDSLVWEIPN